MAKIFLTGITGFLGSNIASYLINEGHELAATYRSMSYIETCSSFKDKVKWVLQEENNNWIQILSDYSPDIIIHSAWIGVGHAERNSWDIQFQNLTYINNILSIARGGGVIKFIALGSQAEYGFFEGCIDEDYETKPTEAYGHVKLICSELVKQFCAYHDIHWYWLRLFSFFGKGESPNWLIPSLVNKIMSDDHMDFTPGEQKYAYLFVDDLALAINNIIKKEDNLSGVYNISASETIKLKDLVQIITNQINPLFQLNFGKLPYRANQPMHMQGNSIKFKKLIGEFEVSDFNQSLHKTIEYLVKSNNKLFKS